METVGFLAICLFAFGILGLILFAVDKFIDWLLGTL